MIINNINNTQINNLINRDIKIIDILLKIKIRDFYKKILYISYILSFNNFNNVFLNKYFKNKYFKSNFLFNKYII